MDFLLKKIQDNIIAKMNNSERKEKIQDIVKDIVELSKSIAVSKLMIEYPKEFNLTEFFRVQQQNLIELSESRIKELTSELVSLIK